MLDPAVDDVHALDAVSRGVERRADLGQHSAGQRPLGHQRIDLFRRQAGEELVVPVEHARRIGEHDELFGLQHLGELSGDEVGVDVVGLPVLAHADRRHHRDKAPLLQRPDHLRVDRGDFADLADVDLPAAVVLVRKQHLPRPDESAVLTGEADRLAARLIDERHDFLVDLAAEHHLDDVHGLGVGDAHALDEFALLAQARQLLVDLRAAAVHDHRVHADQLEQHHVVGKAALEALVGHRVAAVLDDDGLAVEALDVGQRLGEDLGFVDRGQGWIAHRRAHLERRLYLREPQKRKRRPGGRLDSSEASLTGW